MLASTCFVTINHNLNLNIYTAVHDWGPCDLGALGGCPTPEARHSKLATGNISLVGVKLEY
jgi:hypothetical protein